MKAPVWEKSVGVMFIRPDRSELSVGEMSVDLMSGRLVGCRGEIQITLKSKFIASYVGGELIQFFVQICNFNVFVDFFGFGRDIQTMYRTTTTYRVLSM